MNIKFERANIQHIELINKWLAEPHMMDFCDNTQEHKDDILNFIHDRKQHYFYGTTKYWIGLINDDPYCFVLSDILQLEQNLSKVHREYMSTTGHTVGIDFGIGNTKYLGQGLAALTLIEFMNFYHESIDPLTDTFFIDPDSNNPRASHVYNKAGFNRVGEFEVEEGAFKQSLSYLMVRKI